MRRYTSKAILSIFLSLAGSWPLEAQGLLITADSVCLRKANAFVAAGLPDSALLLWTHALDGLLHAVPPDTTRILNARQQRGALRYQLGRFEEALPDLQEALALAQTHYGRGSREAGEALLQVGNVYFQQADYPKADSLYRQGLVVLRAVAGEDDLKTGWAWHNCGLTALYSGRFLAAQGDFENALAIKRKHYGEDNEDVARTLSMLGFLYSAAGDYARGDRYTETAAAISLQAYGSERWEYYAVKHNLIEHYVNRGDYALAKATAREAIAGKITLLDTLLYYSVAGSWNWLGLACQAAGQYDSAEWAFRQALHYHQLSGYPQALDEAHVYHNLGTNALYLGKPEEGLDAIEEALRRKSGISGTATEDYMTSLVMRGSIRLELGQWSEGISDLQQARTYLEANHATRGSDYHYCLERSLHAYTAMARWEEARQAAHRLAATNRIKLTSLTNYGSERELMLANADALETLQQLYRFNALLPDRDDATVRLLADETLFYKGFVLNEMAGIRQRMQRDTGNQAIFAALNRARADLLAVQVNMGDEDPSIPALQHAVDSLEKALVRASTTYAGFRQPLASADVLGALQQGEALLDFFVEATGNAGDSDRYAAFLYRFGAPGPRLVTLGRIPHSADDAREEDDPSGAAAVPDESQWLADSLWTRLLPHLTGIGRMFYVPAGILHGLNLGALSMPDGSLAMEHVDCVRLLDARRLTGTMMPVGKPASAVLFGGIDYDAEDIAPSGSGDTGPPALRGIGMLPGTLDIREWVALPGTFAEVEAVRALLATHHCVTRVYAGRLATEEALYALERNDAPQVAPEILHLATHGYYFPLQDEDQPHHPTTYSRYAAARNPMIRAGLILAGANGTWTGDKPMPPDRDGIATAYEVSQLDLSGTRLVVLSACETGLGDLSMSEGVIGLQRAFRIAGAQRILSSLWKVPDAATAHLMTSFYHNWISEGHTPRVALQRAQLDMRDSGFAPRYWAGFVLVE